MSVEPKLEKTENRVDKVTTNKIVTFFYFLA